MPDPQTSASFRRRVQALVHGVAFGDALGATVEHLTSAEIAPPIWPRDDASTCPGTRRTIHRNRAATGSAATACSPTTRT